MPRFLRLLLTAIGLAAAFAPGHAIAASEDYAIDPVHTRVLVAVEHAGFSHALGTVSGSTGRVAFDPDDWSSATLQVDVPLQRLDFGDEKWNKAVAAGNLLDTARHPTARFVSTRVQGIDATRATVFGNLTVHGVTREVKLDVVLNQLKRHPLPPFRRTAGFSATATLSRADFGITAWKSVIGDEVQLRIEAEATRTRTEAEAESNTDAAPETNDVAAPPNTPDETTTP